mmetsp:Transcript_85711/g.239582  ORF Transcript_85711/g.239582 Transcript_85711/m.239582 type:complete len:510 (-) Transcript_85711:178-1707(-)
MQASGASHVALVAVTTLAGVSLCHGDCTQEVLNKYPSGWPAELDVGIYWFGLNDQFEKACDGMGRTTGTMKFFDPSAPTLIYFHGWTGSDGGWTMKCNRITTSCPSKLCPDDHANTMLADSWLKAGWNVGFFFWDQFADEECTRDAEQKIWFDRGGNGLRWKSFDASINKFEYREFRYKSLSITDMCLQAVKTALRDFSGPQVRFVGHSIGTQLATRCAARLHSENHRAAPKRIALLEPFFTKHHLNMFRCSNLKVDDGIGAFTAEATAGYVKSLWDTKQVVTEVYKSSLLTEMKLLGEPDKELEKLAALVLYHPTWCGGLGPVTSEMFGQFGNLDCRHGAVYPLYFLSFGVPPPPLTPSVSVKAMPGSAVTNCSTPSPSCTDFQVWEWVRRQHSLHGAQKWEQLSGRNTFDVSDDEFGLTPALGQNGDADTMVEESANSGFRNRSLGHDGGGDTLVLQLVAIGALLGCVYCVWRKATTKRQYSHQADEDGLVQSDFQPSPQDGEQARD